MATSVTDIKDAIAVASAKKESVVAQMRALPEGPEKDALRQQRNALSGEINGYNIDLAKISEADTKNNVYMGKDPNTGLNVYTNGATGVTYRSDADPSNSQVAAYDKTQPPAQTTAPQSPSIDPAVPPPPTQANVPVNVEPQQVPIQESVALNESIVPTNTEAATISSESDPGATQFVQAPGERVQYTEPEFIQAPGERLQYPSNDPASEFVQAPGERISYGFQGALDSTRAQATTQDQTGFSSTADWRVRLSLAPGISAEDGYLYLSSDPGILAPLKQTNGIIFPYTPQISVAYTASYDSFEPVHSNFKLFQYKNSGVDNISVTCNFTAQDNYEAAYLLAVIHFLRSVTKMFYGYDRNPKAGTPPPLCYLTGLGQYQFNAHPLVISGFTYTLPDDVDYVRAYTTSFTIPKQSMQDPQQMMSARTAGLPIGGENPGPKWSTIQNTGQGGNQPTYVPTKMQIAFQAHPIITRNAVSNFFSLKDYASGKLLKGNELNMGGYYGGIW